MLPNCVSKGAWAIVFCIGLAAVPVQADSVLLDVSGTTPFGNLVLSDSFQWLGASWTLTTGFTDVSITPILGFDPPLGTFTGTAWLTDAIGSGATMANVLATAPITIDTSTFSPGVSGAMTVLSGLSLGPGTYYLLLTADPTAALAWWPSVDPSTVTVQTVPGVSMNGFIFTAANLNTGFPPASNWDSCGGTCFAAPLQITGNPVVVPEPGTMALLASGLAGIWLRRRRA